MRSVRTTENGKNYYVIVSGQFEPDYRIATRIIKDNGTENKQIVYEKTFNRTISADDWHLKIGKMSEKDFLEILTEWTPPKQTRKRGKKQ